MGTLRVPCTLAALCAFVSAASAATLTVDDSGGANFTTIQAAIQAAAPGDVILVFQGNYAAFSCSKAVTIVGEPHSSGLLRPFVSGVSRFSAASGTIAGLELKALQLAGCSGTVIVDDLVIESTTCDSAVWVSGCASVAISRCRLAGKQGDKFCETTALTVDASTVTVSESTLTGGRGGVDGCYGFAGRPALFAWKSANVTVVDSTLTGGDGSMGSPSLCLPSGGPGAPAIDLFDVLGTQTRCTVRGSGIAALVAGVGYSGSDTTQVQYPWAVTGGRLTISGVAAIPPAFDVETLTQPSPAESLVVLQGLDVGGSIKTFGVAGALGGQFLVFATFGAPQSFVAPGISGPLWLAPGSPVAVVPLSTATQTFVTFDIPLPASLAGIHGAIASFQTVQIAGAPLGGVQALNPAVLVVR